MTEYVYFHQAVESGRPFRKKGMNEWLTLNPTTGKLTRSDGEAYTDLITTHAASNCIWEIKPKDAKTKYYRPLVWHKQKMTYIEAREWVRKADMWRYLNNPGILVVRWEEKEMPEL